MRAQSLGRGLGAAIVGGIVAGLACTPGTPDPVVATSSQLPDRGVTLVAIGDSFSSGFINGALIGPGQESGFANLLNQQAGWATFSQPIIGSPGIGSELVGGGGFVEGMRFVNSSGEIVADSTVLAAVPALLENVSHPIGYNNLGVPGGLTADILNATSSTTSAGQSPFFDFILRNSIIPPGGTTQRAQLTALLPDVVALWTGVMDIYRGAITGNPDIDPTNGNVTPNARWSIDFRQVAGSVAAVTDKVVVGNIPQVTDVAFFISVPLGADPDGGGPSGTLRWNMQEDIDAGGAALDSVMLVLVTAPVVADPGSYLPLGAGGASADTVGSEFTLTLREINTLSSEINAYNATITDVTTENAWGLADVEAEMASLPRPPSDPTWPAQLNPIFPWDSTNQVQNVNAAYGLDGLHLSQKGQARVANLFIEAFNDLNQADFDIPAVDESQISNTLGFENAP